LKLSLKVLADVGLLGFPNAGKSTLINSITNAKSKVSDYAFTTLTPKLGVVNRYDKTFVITDLPGLIEGASDGKGMGIKFLKHLSRVRIIIHLIDSSLDDFEIKYKQLRNELDKFSDFLSGKKEIIVFSKSDLIKENKKNDIINTFPNKELYFISSINKEGINKLLDKVFLELDKIYKLEKESYEDLMKNDDDYVEINLTDESDPLIIEKQDNI